MTLAEAGAATVLGELGRRRPALTALMDAHDEAAPDDMRESLGYGIVISQTCDVAASGPGRRHPTVQVSPVIDLVDRKDDQDECSRLSRLRPTEGSCSRTAILNAGS